MQAVQFNKTGHEPFLDFIKAFAIVCVLIGHTFPYLDAIGYGLWAGMQVPLFVLVQSFHSLKRTESKLDLKKLFWRILVPYVFIQLIIFTIYVAVSSDGVKSLIIKFVIGGGYGPGSYFPWIYFQLAIVLKFVRPLFDKSSRLSQSIIAILLCELFEILCSIINFPDCLYRLLAIRYFFLIFLAWLWVKDGIKINVITIILSLISAGAIVYFEYFANDTEPLFYRTAWSFHRWPCYFFVSNLMCYVLYHLYRWVVNYSVVDKIVKLLSKCSYEIFLVQMVACLFTPPLVHSLSFNKYVDFGVSVSLIFIVSIFGGYLYNNLYGKLINWIK